jgi:hydroxymethylglutaryl-CoA lyase
MRSVEILEVSPRDGLQLEKTILPTAMKVELIERAIAAGLRRVEVASFVNPARVPQMADAADVLAALKHRDGVVFTGLVLNRKGAERALRAGCDEIGMVVVASDTFNRRNQGASTEESIATWVEVAAMAREAGIRAQVTIAASFGCPFEGEVPLERVVEIARQVAVAQPFEICFADTIGVGVPLQIRRLLERARRALPDTRLRCHFHNTRNTGIANAIAAVEAGVTTLDSSAGGIGGCPFAPAATGNIATEDLIYVLERSGIHTGVSLPGMIDVAKWLGHQLGRATPGMLSKAGPFPNSPSTVSETA